MKKIGYIIAGIIAVLFYFDTIYDLIYGLIYHTKETLLFILCMVLFGIYIAFAIKLNNKLRSKNKIDWSNYTELDTICGWLCFASWLFLTLTILFIILPIISITSTEASEYNMALVHIIISIFSFWTYFSLILGKRNVLFIIRSYIISIGLLMVFSLVRMSQRMPDIDLGNLFYTVNLSTLPIMNIIDCIIAFIFICAIIALFIKGLIISYKPHIVKFFKDSKSSYWQILLIILLWASIITCYNTRITYTKEKDSDFPALNVSK